ncbi:hypothetical protein K488DRAFT_83675 [Vararia minispora EC-137]|uniref:Uncharacterized protein n=1 Tax=Vararia minispora EC-137 TaxID=1314806 RepID=A0ACB8QSS6_9AGAM|nr:hypothetical protein K488DRAFT_83675 [Vararia minispora EC-137]
MTTSLRDRGDDDVWEDVKQDDEDDASETRSETQYESAQGASPRRRKPVQRKIFVAASPRRSNARLREQRRNVSGDVSDVLRDGGIESARYAAGVLKITLRMMKHPLALLLFLWIFAFIVELLSNTLRAALMPLCTIPGFALLCPATLTPAPSASGRASHRPPKQADFPSLMDMQGKTLDALLDETVDGTGLSLEVKKAEMATADLATLVRVSDLTSRERLAEMLVEFVDDARETARLLQRFSAQVSGAVDSVVAINDYALHTIEAATARSNSIVANIYVLIPFMPSNQDLENQRVTGAFASAMDVIADNIGRLQLEAAAVLARLDRLEARLSGIHALVAQEDSSLSVARDELLAQLWTKLGGNAKTLRGMDTHRALLGGVGHYRAVALARIVATIQTLNAHQEDMEVLRERVAAPALAGERIPVEAHVRSIGAGLRRLKERSERAEKRRQEITDAHMRNIPERALGAGDQ